MPNRRLIFALISMTLLAAACGSTNDGDSAGGLTAQEIAEGQIDGELFDFELIRGSDFVFEADPNDPNRGIFRVTTSEEAICAIVWGETDEFGNFNNSLAMNGTGIIDHDVVLPGAEQGKEYFFRVQGTTADGRQFRSETGTFVIPVTESGGNAADEIDRGDNLALNATVVDASSSFGVGWEADNAIDGDTNTEWSSAGDGDDGSITIDLGSEQNVGGVEFITRRMLDGTAITDTYTITVDDDMTFGPFPAGSPADSNFTAIDFTGQVIRFDVETSTGGNVGAVEVRVFGP